MNRRNTTRRDSRQQDHLPRDDALVGEQISQTIYTTSRMLCGDSCLDEAGCEVGAVQDEHATFDGLENVNLSATSLPDDRQSPLLDKALNTGPPTRLAPALDPLCLENSSCAQSKKRRRRKKQDDKSFPVELSRARIDPASSNISNFSPSAVAPPNGTSLDAHDRTENTFKPERFQYLFDFLNKTANASDAPRHSLA